MRTTHALLLSLLMLAAGIVPATAQTFRSDETAEAVRNGFGRAVAVASGTVFVGEPANTYRPGVVYVYEKDADGRWVEQAQLVAPDAFEGDHFGEALATDAGQFLVGAPQQSEQHGSAYLFTHDDASGAWVETGRLVASDGAPEDGFGAAVALNGDLAVVGAPAHAEDAGAVYVFRRDAATGTWTETAKLAGSAAQAESVFGAALATTGDRIFVGAPGQGTGALYVFAFDAATGAWNEEAMLVGSTASNVDRFGSAVALHDDVVLVGAPRHDEIGAVFAFAYDEAQQSWNEQGRLLPFDGGQRHFFGASIASNGGEAWIGAPGAHRGAGATYVFRSDAARPGWSGVTQLLPRERERGDMFGSALATGANVAVVGLAGDDYGAGTAIVFERASAENAWEEQTRLAGEVADLDPITGDRVPCTEGDAGLFDCRDVDLLAFLPIRDLGGARGVRLNDIWGWTDPETGREYALVGRMDGASFVDITDPTAPVYLGDLPMTEGANGSSWRDIKVYADHAFIVADNAGQHGMQVFDLRQLRDVKGAPVTFEATAHYDEIASAHNVVINEETGFAYIVGSGGGGTTCGGGLHMVNIQDPTNPTFAGCFADPSTGRRGTGYTHDAQCIVYNGPDADHRGKEICFGSNETALSIADVSNKENPVALSVAEYPNVSYTHQGWITDDHRYFFVNDELDELSGNVPQTRTLIWDVTDLDDPQLIKEYYFGTESSDHNLYIRGTFMYQSNYASGLRIHDVSDVNNPVEVAHFDTTPVGSNGPGFSGSWSNYPYFESGTIAVSSIGEGLFLVKKSKPGL